VSGFLSVIDRISEWTGKLFSYLLLVATAVVVYEVVRRYVFNAPSTFGLELTIYLCAITYLIGGAYALLYDAHVKVDLFYLRWSPRVRAIMDLVMSPFFYIGVCAIVYVGAMWTARAIAGGVTSGSTWDPDIWPMRLVIALGAFLLLMQGIAKSIRDFKVARGGKRPS
jgi:TRAP-type mannitol/chloroaromatic compound transport system permease small subunit